SPLSLIRATSRAAGLLRHTTAATTGRLDLRRGHGRTCLVTAVRPRPVAALGVAWNWSENQVFRPVFIQTSSSSISSVSQPNQSSEAPGVRLIHRRDPRGVQLARTSSRRRTKETTRAIILAPDPPPKCRISLIALVEDFGFGQNTEETLPNFRQKLEENYLRKG
ncbi:hypothetical protein Prudu_013369, partial [Prunus dulcis]